MSSLYLQVDWRGDGPGCLGMESPPFPRTIAGCRRLFGQHEVAYDVP